MRLTRENTIRVHRGEITPGQAFAEQEAEGAPAQIIPHILHFIWFGNEEPELVTWLRQSVVDQYPGWEVKVWRDKPTDWPQEWEEAWNRRAGHLPHQSDILRWWALLSYGGIYYDSDFLGVRPLPDRVLGASFAGGYQGSGRSSANRVQITGNRTSAHCGLMVSIAGGREVRWMAQRMLRQRSRNWLAYGPAIVAAGHRRFGFEMLTPDEVYPIAPLRGPTPWQHAYDYAMNSAKPPPTCAVHLWMAGEGYQECNAKFVADCRHVAVVTKGVIESPFFGVLRATCNQQGLPLKFYTNESGFRARRRASEDFVTWGVKWKSEWYRRGGRNVLFIENGLLRQRSGIYVDHAGYFCDSSIATESQPDPTAVEVAALQAHVRHCFGWDWFAGGDPAGPIMIACQTHNDCSVRYHYHPGRGSAPAMQPLLDACADYLPSHIPVIVRPHPKSRVLLNPDWLRPGWTLDTSPDVYATLRTCRALVTISSTLSTEALALGLPVACLGRSAWEGHGVVLECATDYGRLAGLPDWAPEEWPVLRYLCAVMRHQLPYDATPDQVQGNASIRTWLGRAGHPIQVQGLADQVTAAAAQIRSTNDPAALEHLLVLEAKLADCKVCSRARLQRKIIELAKRGVRRLA